VLGTTRRGRKSATKSRSSGRGEWRERGTSYKFRQSLLKRGIPVVSYQIIEYFAIEQALFGILEIQVPASAAHGNWIDIYDASSQVAYCV
jgi:hypothetical protein